MILLSDDTSLISVFQLPLFDLDEGFLITSQNDSFQSLFDTEIGQDITSLSADFVTRKCQRAIEASKPYRFRIDSKALRPMSYQIELHATKTGYSGFATDASLASKAEALMASYSQMIEKQNREIKEKTEQLNIWSKRIQEELAQARTVQTLLVPDNITAASLHSICVPLHELSGDFHEVAYHADGSVTYISGDVAGKGIYAAILLAQTLTAFRAFYDAPTLTDLLCHIVRILEDRFPDGLFVALTLVRQSADKQQVSLLNCGNPDSLYVAADGHWRRLGSGGPAIGILPEDFYRTSVEETLSLSSGRLYVFSDGILDLVDETGRAFETEDEAYQCLASQDQALQSKTPELFRAIAARYPQADDVTLACFYED